jgi:hypothetical protein
MVFIATPLFNGTIDEASYSIVRQNKPTANRVARGNRIWNNQPKITERVVACAITAGTGARAGAIQARSNPLASREIASLREATRLSRRHKSRNSIAL